MTAERHMSVDLPVEAYPVRIDSIAERTGEVVHSVEAAEPGVMVIPGLRAEHGPITVRVFYAGRLICEVDSQGNETLA